MIQANKPATISSNTMPKPPWTFSCMMEIGQGFQISNNRNNKNPSMIQGKVAGKDAIATQ